jgi:cytochrome d ubiquinol oxidase subunit I
LVAVIFGWFAWRRGASVFELRWLLRLIAVTGALGFVGLEAGWIVTEAGRQPWIINGIMRTADAVTQAANVASVFWAYAGLYAALGVTSVALLRWIARNDRHMSGG